MYLACLLFNVDRSNKIHASAWQLRVSLVFTWLLSASETLIGDPNHCYLKIE